MVFIFIFSGKIRDLQPQKTQEPHNFVQGQVAADLSGQPAVAQASISVKLFYHRRMAQPGSQASW